jgi:hypothetical protein
MRKDFLIGYAKFSNCTNGAVIRDFEGIPWLDRASPWHPIVVRQNTSSIIPFILFILSRNRRAKNWLFANLALAADDVLISC